jgi:hypothetical protein
MQTTFDSRLSLLEMMLLERNRVRRNKSPTFFGVPLPPRFSLSAVMAFIPISIDHGSSDGLLYLNLAIAVCFIFFLGIRRNKKAKHSDAATNLVKDAANQTISVNESLLAVRVSSEKDFHDDDIISPLQIRNMMNADYKPNNIPTEIAHEVSCEESVESTPSLPHSEPTFGHSTPLRTKESHRKRFRIRKWPKSDGIRTP